DGRGPGQKVHQRQPLDEALARDPLALALDLVLHDAHHGRAAVAHRAELQEDAADLPGAGAHGAPVAVRSANSVTESALVHSPMKPRVYVVSLWSSSAAPSSQAWMRGPVAVPRGVCHAPSFGSVTRAEARVLSTLIALLLLASMITTVRVGHH